MNIHYWKSNTIVCLLDFKLVAKMKECAGSETYAGNMKTVDFCSHACIGKASMFIYGLAPYRCNKDSCKCICETASTDGKCTMKDHAGFNLYAYSQFKKIGEILITISIFSLLTNYHRTLRYIDITWAMFILN